METIKIPEPVIVEPVATPKVTTDKGAVAEPKSTAEEDRKSLGQRHINLIWESTQAIIAISITASIIYVEAITGRHSEGLSNAFTAIIMVYFIRMNHVKIGGVGGTDTR